MAHVLLLGEANFSFALALRGLLEAPSHGSDEGRAASARRLKEQLATVAGYLHLLGNEISNEMSITASGYEAPAEVLQKYPESASILSRLSHLGVDVSRVLRAKFQGISLGSSHLGHAPRYPEHQLQAHPSHADLIDRMKRDYDHLFKLVLHLVHLVHYF